MDFVSFPPFRFAVSCHSFVVVVVVVVVVAVCVVVVVGVRLNSGGHAMHEAEAKSHGDGLASLQV